MEFAHLLDTKFLGNTLFSWGLAVLAAVGTWLVLFLARRIVVRALRKFARKTETGADDIVVAALARTKGWVILVVALFAGARLIDFPARADKAFVAVLVLALIVQGGIWLDTALSEAMARARKKHMDTDPASLTTVTAAGFIARFALWSILVLLALDNLGFNITSLVAGLGIGGVAIALAVQNILGDVFAAMSIVLDKPFAVGDFVVVGEMMGSVEQVGIKTTRVRSLSGEQLVFANSDLLSSRIRNFGRMYRRRVVFTVGVTYQTPRAQLEQIPGILRKAIESQDGTQFDRSHFRDFGDFALNFETVYYVLSSDYNVYMDVQQAINLYVHREFEQRGIEFAYPTQTLFVANTTASS